jgi:L-amino acid N-acyltransferase YncA
MQTFEKYKAFESFVVRPGTLRDLYSLIDIGNKDLMSVTFLQADWLEKKTYLDHLVEKKHQNMSLWIAEDDDKNIVGWQALLPYERDLHSNKNFAETITYVSDQTYTAWLGNSLLEPALAKAKEEEYDYLLTYIVSTNTFLQHVVEKAGFNRISDLIESGDAKVNTPNFFIYLHSLKPGR